MGLGYFLDINLFILVYILLFWYGFCCFFGIFKDFDWIRFKPKKKKKSDFFFLASLGSYGFYFNSKS